MNANDEYFADCARLPEIALPFMNQVHCEELALVAELAQALQHKATIEHCDALFMQWVQHTEEHFTREENLMREYDFFAFLCHQGEHQQALEELLAVQRYWQTERDSAGILDYIGQWRDWLQNHIATMDFVTAQYLSQFPLSVEV